MVKHDELVLAALPRRPGDEPPAPLARIDFDRAVERPAAGTRDADGPLQETVVQRPGERHHHRIACAGHRRLDAPVSRR